MSPNNNGLGLKTIYIDTEGSFTAHRYVRMYVCMYAILLLLLFYCCCLIRLIQIAKHLCSASDKVIKRTANNITVYTELTCESFNKRYIQ